MSFLTLETTSVRRNGKVDTHGRINNDKFDSEECILTRKLQSGMKDYRTHGKRIRQTL